MAADIERIELFWWRMICKVQFIIYKLAVRTFDDVIDVKSADKPET